MDRKLIEFRQLCALVRAIVQAEPTIDDAEWKARTLAQMAKWGFAEPSDKAMLGRAMTQVEFAMRKTLGPRLAPLRGNPEAPSKPQPPQFEGRTNRPLGWDLVERLMARLQGSVPSVPTLKEPDPHEIGLTEVAAVDEFWHQCSDRNKTDRLALLRAFAEIAIIRSVTWNPKQIRAEAAGDRRLSNAACFACGRAEGCSLHHIIQIQHGGSNYLRNRVSLCDACHAAVHPWLAEVPRSASGWTHITGMIPMPGGGRVKERA